MVHVFTFSIVITCTEEPRIDNSWRWMKRYKRVFLKGYKGLGRGGRKGTKPSQPGSTLGAPARRKG